MITRLKYLKKNKLYTAVDLPRKYNDIHIKLVIKYLGRDVFRYHNFEVILSDNNIISIGDVVSLETNADLKSYKLNKLN